LEEPSMLEVMKVLTQSLVPKDVLCRFIRHEGIRDLERSMPRKLRGWINADAAFVVVREMHSGDCKSIKQDLLNLCRQGRRPETLVHIVCHELESWFLGDLAAVEKAFPSRRVARHQNKSKYWNPDRLANAADELRRLVPEYQKIGGSRKIAPNMKIEENKSHSFHVLIDGIRQLASKIS